MPPGALRPTPGSNTYRDFFCYVQGLVAPHATLDASVIDFPPRLVDALVARALGTGINRLARGYASLVFEQFSYSDQLNDILCYVLQRPDECLVNIPDAARGAIARYVLDTLIPAFKETPEVKKEPDMKEEIKCSTPSDAVPLPENPPGVLRRVGQKVTSKGKRIAMRGAARAGAKQVLRMTRDPLLASVAMLLPASTRDTYGPAVAAFFSTPAGEAVFQLIVGTVVEGLAEHLVPKEYHALAEAVGVEMQDQGSEFFADHVMEAMLGPVRASIVQAIVSLPSGIRVEQIPTAASPAKEK